jgi:hypothetical protein
MVHGINVSEDTRGWNGQSRDTSSIGYTRHRTKKNKIKQNTTEKTKAMRNPSKTIHILYQ